VRYPRIRLLAGLLTLQLAVQLFLAPVVGLDQLGLRQRLTQPEQVYDRVAVSATASNMVEHRPLFGFGFGILTFNEDKADYYASWAGISPRWAVYPNNPHNDFLNVLVMMGVVGLFPYVALLWTSWQLLRRSRDRWQRSSLFDPELATFVQAVFLVLIIAGQMHSAMHMSYAQVLFFFLLGIAGRGLAETAQAADGGRPSQAATASAWLVRPAAVTTIATGGER
jgi:O-antigen ligase